MLVIRLPRSIEKRLEKLAQRTGRTKSYYVRQAILQRLEDLEDTYLAERALERIRNDEEPTVPLEDVIKRYSVEGSVSCRGRPRAHQSQGCLRN
jgi:RHH-type rel operon transcriptional repressor/antitoxin RelB